ncbi:hypothetical protein BKE30_07200 [Alkanindiges hydrocarboniclasticus]|uniref:Uncharacterized protein n=1 Tax=Alkanindiges hydrocarboniclasticus TaxID=1907941 RepID=A0A1S8CWT8_9GAMM|nr:DUF6502 family protein [Alkanindiges hydrocarboniclasticus]ONG40595.1 hypothetical protein BKE30_07200 [Alkanindiges hydrocarboniclasticus]
MGKLLKSTLVKEDSLLLAHGLSHEAETTLEHALMIMQELARWLIKSGIGYTEFSAVLKPIFYNEAIREIERLNQKKTDSSISLLSGLNRRDISTLRHNNNDVHQLIHHFAEPASVISVPARVVGIWVNDGLPQSIPVSGHEVSFENLVRKVSTEKHPRSILLELKRIGIVKEENDRVILQANSFTPSPENDELKQMFVANITDHLAAGIHNIVEKENKFLEQAIFADELTLKSIQHLKETSMKLWNEMSRQILAEAIDCCKQDEGRQDATLNFRLGIFQYDDSDE